jgi:hypothetical protein
MGSTQIDRVSKPTVNGSLAIKAPCRVATTADLTPSLSQGALGSGGGGLFTIDGVALNAGDRVLVKNQTDQTTNGIWVAATTSWLRDVDSNSNTSWLRGTIVLATDGATQAGLWFELTSANPIIIGTSLIAFVVTSNPTVSGAMAPVVGAATLAAARTALGASAASAAVFTAPDNQTILADIAPGLPSLTEDLTPDASGDLLLEYDLDLTAGRAVRPVNLIAAAAGFSMINGDLVASVAANALTIALKTKAGNDPSAADPVWVLFRNATVTLGQPSALKITAATSFTVPNTATLGTVNATPFRLWVVGINDAGTFRLGVINCVSGTDVFPLRDDALQSPITPAASLAQTVYANAGSLSKASRILGYMEWSAGLAAAGTWASGPTKVQHFHYGVSLPGTVVQSVSQETGAVATGTSVFPVLADTALQNTGGDQYMSKAVTPTATMNVLQIEAEGFFSASTANTNLEMGIFQDAIAAALASGAILVVSTGATNPMTYARLRHKMAAGTVSATTIKFRAGQLTGSAVTITFNGTAGGRLFAGTIPSTLSIAELMA